MSTPAPLPPNERERVAALHALSVLDSEPEERFDRLTRIAARALRTPIALVSLVDSERQWFKSSRGLERTETPRAESFCAHAVAADAPLVVPDTTQDARFANNALVTGKEYIRYYAGHPLRAPGGEPVGTLCVLDHVPRTPAPEDMALLADLAQVAETELNAEALSRSLAARRGQEERLEALVAMQDQFVRLAAHELRTPLTSILGYGEMLAEGVAGELNEKQREMTEVVLRNANRLSELVEDSLLVLRLEAGRLPLAPERTDLAEVVRAAARDVRGQAKLVGVTIAVTGTAGAVEADPRLLQRAAAGLLRRAVAESPAGARVDVAVAASGELATLAVTDAGRSLEPEELERVGERFYRDTTHDGSGSTGLALTIARGVAELHGGRMRVASTPGRGTTATLELPVR